MSTTIDSLELEITSNSEGAVEGIKSLTQSLEKLKTATKGGLGLKAIAKGMQAINDVDLSKGEENIRSLVDTLSPLSSLSKSNLSSFITPLKNLPKVFSELNKVDMDAFAKKIQEVATAVRPLADEMQKVANGFSAMPTKIRKLLKETDKIPTSNKKASASFTDLYHKISSGIRVISKLSGEIWSAITKSNDYIENVNLFTVAMGEYASDAMIYAETVSDAMGVDTSEWIRAQGVFMTLATGFGVASDRAYTMSKNLTQLSYDLSSFYNMDVDDALTKVKSGLAGELEPLRAIGYDLSQAKLEATAVELGITKSVSAMTQAEKAQLRYYAIMTQVTKTHGDMARTLDDPANQLRVLTAQINMAAREIGNIFIPALNAILPYAIAVAKVVRNLAASIAGLFGYEASELGESMDKVVTNTDTITENLENSKEEAKKLKSYMLGFDELNVINPNTDTDDTLGEFDFPLPEYNFLEGLAESRVAQIVEGMTEWLGLTEDIDTWGELFETRLGRILKIVGLIGAEIALWKLTQTFIDSIKLLNTLLSNPTYAIAIGIALTITGFVMTFDGLKSAIEDGLDGFDFAEIIGGVLVSAASTALLGSKIATLIITSFSGSKVAMALTGAAIKLFAKTAGPITAGAVSAAGGILLAAITGIILGIPMYFVGIYDACMEGLDWLNGLLVAAGSTLVGASIGFILGGPVGAGIGALIGLAVGLITDLVILIVQNWETISEWFTNAVAWIDTNVIQPVAGFFRGLWESISTFFSNLWNDIVAIWTLVATWFNDTIITPVVNFFRGLWEAVSGFFVNLWNDIVTVWITVATWFDTNVIQPIASFFEGVALRIGQFFEGCWIIIQAVWFIASTWFNENVIIPIVNFFKALWESVSGFFTQLWADIVAIWNTVADWFNEYIIIPIVEFFRGVWLSVSSFFVNLWAGIKNVWITVATWFNINVIIPVVSFFRGVWTSISSFFTKLWEDIKTVWKSVANWFDVTIIQPVKTAFDAACKAIKGFFSSLWLGIRQGVAGAMNGVIGAIESAINWVVGGINKLIGGFNDVVQWAADVIGADWGGVTLLKEVSFSRVTVPTYAEGGFPEQGQMFIAREAGVEMVGNIGRRTAVANNDQIVAGIAGGVAEANEEQNSLLREQNSLLRAILEKESGVYLDGKKLTNSVEKYQRERGRNLITGGVI